MITHGVHPSLHLEYKRCGVKQYFKDGRALRTETTINDAGDFHVSRGLQHFDTLRTLGQRTNTRLLELVQVADDCGLVETDLRELTLPSRTPTGQPAPSFRLGEPRVTALFQRLCLFALTPVGITNRQLRPLVAQLLGVPDEQYTARQMGYNLRRLAREGPLERCPGKLSYTLTPWGWRVALFLTKLHVRIWRPGFQAIDPRISSHAPPAVRITLQEVGIAVRLLARQAGLAA